VKINGVDTEEFARQVESLCDYLLDQISPKTGTKSQRIIEDIRGEAIKLQVDDAKVEIFEGLEAHMRGVPE
jgi:hypothetical protein